jgi:lysozyme
MNLDRLADDLIADEGLKLEAYRCTEGFLTIGVGRNLDTNPLTPNERQAVGHDGREKPITHNQAMYLLDNSMLKLIANLDAHIPWWSDLDEVRQLVLANMGYQLGVPGLLKFKNMLADCKAGKYEAAAFEIINSRYSLQTPNRAARQANRMKRGKME